MKRSIAFSLLFVSSVSIATSNAKKESPPKNVIGMEKAKLAALKVTAGKIEGSELEFEKHQWLYSFDIRASDHRIHEIQIGAVSGKVVGNDIETPNDEAKEAAEDAAL